MQSEVNGSIRLVSRQVATTSTAQRDQIAPGAQQGATNVNYINQRNHPGTDLVCPLMPSGVEPPDPRARVSNGGASHPDAEPLVVDNYRIVIPVRDHDYAIGVRTQPQIEEAAAYTDTYYHLLGATTRPDSDVKQLSQLLLTLTRKFSRAEAESLALQDAGDIEISDEVLRRDAKHLRELGSFSALVEYHNNVQKSTGLNLER
eukprot:gene59952-82023_t